jgi:hypothetical protein
MDDTRAAGTPGRDLIIGFPRQYGAVLIVGGIALALLLQSCALSPASTA